MNMGLESFLRQKDKRFDRLEFDYRYADDYQYLDEIEYFLPNIVDAFEENETVKCVKIGQEFMLSFSEDVLCTLFDAIARLPKLEDFSLVLWIGRRKRPSMPVRALINLVRKAKGLTRMTLQNIRFFGSSKAVQDLAHAIQNHPSLRTVVFGNCHIDSSIQMATREEHTLDGQISMTTKFLQLICCSNRMKELHLDNVNLTDENIGVMMKSLKRNRILRVLSLTSCVMTSKASIEIANMLQLNKTLDVLSLNGSYISDDGCMAIAKALQTNIKLRKLRVRNCEISEKGHEALAQMLRKNLILDELDTSAVGQSYSNISALLHARRKLLPLVQSEHTTSHQWVDTLGSGKHDLNYIFSFISLDPSFLLAHTL